MRGTVSDPGEKESARELLLESGSVSEVVNLLQIDPDRREEDRDLARRAQECLELELGLQHISFESQVQLPLDYKGIRLKQRFIPDIICFGKIIVELKAVSAICDEHRAQVLNDLNATGYKLGLLVNFGHHPKMQIERFAL